MMQCGLCSVQLGCSRRGHKSVLAALKSQMKQTHPAPWHVCTQRLQPKQQQPPNKVSHPPRWCLLVACLCSCCSCCSTSCPSCCCCPAAGATHTAVGTPCTARAVGGAPRQADPPQGSISSSLCGSSQQWAVVFSPAEPGVEGVLRGCSRGDGGAPGCYSRGGRYGRVAVDVAGGCGTGGWGTRACEGRQGCGTSGGPVFVTACRHASQAGMQAR